MYHFSSHDSSLIPLNLTTNVKLYNYVHTYHGTYKKDLFGDLTVPNLPSDSFLIPILPGQDDELPQSYPRDTQDASTFPRTDTVKSDFSTASNQSPDQDATLDKFKLFAVFDGHCGKFAASYLQYRFPFQLCGSDLFKEGKYEEALKETYALLHTLLKECTKYGPERPYVPYLFF